MEAKSQTSASQVTGPELCHFTARSQRTEDSDAQQVVQRMLTTDQAEPKDDGDVSTSQV